MSLALFMTRKNFSRGKNLEGEPQGVMRGVSYFISNMVMGSNEIASVLDSYAGIIMTSSCYKGRPDNPQIVQFNGKRERTSASSDYGAIESFFIL